MYHWLSYGNSSYFYKREFSFTIDDVYLRYRSYKSLEDFQQNVLQKNPNKIDLGPAYSVSPAEQHSVAVSKFIPESKEYVLDIDISDYDNVRYCGCKEAKTCPKCWKLMTCGSRILDLVLDKVFGAKDRLWIFSGRRGIHCWVCNPKSRNLKNNERTAMTEFLQLYRKKIQLMNPQFPTFSLTSEVYKIAEKFFLEIYCTGYDGMCEMLDEPNDFDKLLMYINNQTTKKAVLDYLTKQMDKSMRPADKWAKVKDIIAENEKRTYMSTILEIVYSHVYPRLDENVSKHLNHLLKSPWCIHPGTGNICVPFDINEEFDITNPPNISLLHEKDCMETMTPFLGLFSSFVKGLHDQMDLE